MNNSCKDSDAALRDGNFTSMLKTLVYTDHLLIFCSLFFAYVNSQWIKPLGEWRHIYVSAYENQIRKKKL